MEIILSPSILSADFSKLGEQIHEVEESGNKWLHIDVMDGVFVPNISFAFPVIESIRPVSNLFFDVHLMITEPERYIQRFIDAGADLVTFHAEATKDIEGCIDIIKANNKLASIAINPNTPIDVVIPYLDKVDMVLCMTVEPGYGGQKYIASVEEKLKKLRALAGPDLLIQVDGGVSAANICEPAAAGANVIVAGSAVFNGSISERIKELREACGQL